MRKLVLLGMVLIVFIGCSSVEKPKENMTMKINENWTFKQRGKTEWLTAKVPGDVHSDLLRNEIIEEPYYRLNEHDLQWIDKEDWEYKTNFDVEESLFQKDKIEMVFHGLDTYAEVSLNGKIILNCDNMFRTWKTDVKDHLKLQNNELKVLIKSAITIGLEKLAKEKIQYPAPPNDLSEIGKLGDKKVSIFTRKAGYHYGWDWGPRFVTSGIWRPIEINAWNDAKIEDVFFKQINLSDKKAEMNALLEINADQSTDYEIRIMNGTEVLTKKSIDLKNGSNNIKVPFEIIEPKLWWPNGLGEQPLYNLSAEIYIENKRIDTKTHKIGIRTIEIVQEKDKYGESFYFKVNGHPVFAKGANYIPNDIFLNEVTPEKYEYIIQSAVDANMNMLRVWGGGIYENEIFYRLCDEKGLMIWQDFMFACSMYPGDEAFLENVKQESIDNVKRLRNHPSVALWCGNNENRMGWTWWGWEKKMTKEQGQEVIDQLFGTYRKMYHKILPETVKKYDGDRFYWPSSPVSAWGKLPNFESGDYHYWGVWWGKESFNNYETVMPRFMSEYGFQSFPEFSTVKKYTEPEDYDIYSEVMKSHQRSSIGNVTIEEYMLRDYKKPQDFESYLYVSHVLQAEGVGFGIEAHRRNRDKCMGTLFWQLNDCWPVASWSSIDYYGKWKALQYYAKKLFKPILVSPHKDDGKINIHIVSDLLENQSAKLKLVLMDFDGNVKWEKIEAIEVAANSGNIYYSIDEQELLKLSPKNRSLLKAVVELPNGKIASENIYYFDKPKNLDFDDAEIKYLIEGNSKDFKFKLSSEKLAKNLYITIGDCEGFLSDNYFDLLPGEEVEITFTSDKTIKKDNIKLSFKMINEL